MVSNHMLSDVQAFAYTLTNAWFVCESILDILIHISITFMPDS